MEGREKLGKTPLPLTMSPGTKRRLELRMRGYRKAKREVEASDAPRVKVILKKRKKVDIPIM